MNQEELLELIENAAKEEATELVLRSNQLRQLPPEIIHLTNLTELNLRRNQLGEVPPQIVHLTNLTELDLSRNQLSELPPEIWWCSTNMTTTPPLI